MAPLKNDLRTLIDGLKTQRDVIALKIYLAKSDAKDEWELLERKWNHFSARSEQIKKELQEASTDIGDDLKYLGEDLREGYSRIKNLLH